MSEAFVPWEEMAKWRRRFWYAALVVGPIGLAACAAFVVWAR